MGFYPGQQVVCVNAHGIPDARNDYLEILHEGNVYTVRDVVDNPKYASPGYGLRLNTILLPHCLATGMEEAWHPARFRPCASTDIGIFTSILRTIPEKVDA